MTSHASPAAPRRAHAAIDSPRNPRICDIRRLEEDPAARRASGCAVAWGRHLALEALDAGVELRSVLLEPGLESTVEGRAILERLAPHRKACTLVTRRVLESIAAGAGDQGILLVVRRPAVPLESVLDSSPSLLMMAHGVQDPGNLGSIARTLLAFGGSALIALEGCADLGGSRALRASMGALLRLPVVRSSTPLALAGTTRAGLQIVATVPGGSDRPDRIDLRQPTALLIGSEGAGLPEAVRRAAHRTVGIPMASAVGSLNVHAAATVLLYEMARQRGFTAST